MFTLDFSSRKAIHEQIYNNIVRLISVGVLKPGDRLPTVRALALDLSVNPNTVGAAYRRLEHDGFIYTVVGRGSFVSDNTSSQSAEKVLALEKVEAAVRDAETKGATRQELLEIIDRAFPN